MATTTRPLTGPAWVSVRVPAGMRDQLVRAAEEHDRCVSAEIRRALTEYLEPRGKRAAVARTARA